MEGQKTSISRGPGGQNGGRGAAAAGQGSGEKVRLNKFLAQAGVCSRRDADNLILAGRVTVNGAVAETGCLVGGQDQVRLDGRPVGRRERRVVLAYYKPAGVTCTARDRHAETTVEDAVHYPVRLTYAGRLDRDAEGLLLLTNDGDLINGLMRGSAYHEKEYLVEVSGTVTTEFLTALSAGVYLPDLDVTTRPCYVRKEDRTHFRIVLTQGLNRQIRRMCSALHYHILSIRRVRVANVELGNLKPGRYRPVEGEELRTLLALAREGEKRALREARKWEESEKGKRDFHG